MDERLKITFEWLARDVGDDIARAFAASIGIAVDNIDLTCLNDSRARTTRETVRGCAWHLAMWFASNWWRLRWEPDGRRTAREDVDWQVAHNLASAGGGVVWPDIVFDSDGDTVGVSLESSTEAPPFEPVRYLNVASARVSTREFERTVDLFLEAVCERGAALKIREGTVSDLWREVQAERRDEEISRQRKWEALAGYDPDEAPEQVLNSIVEAGQRFGRRASEEVASDARHDTVRVLEAIRNLPSSGAVSVILPDLAGGARSSTGAASEPPWQQAESLARQARQEWHLGDGPLSNQVLAGLVGARADLFTEAAGGTLAMPFVLQGEAGEASRLSLTCKPPTSRRFAVSRLLGDHLFFATQDRLRPATGTKTVRQKVQRAFAQAFLCPFEALMSQLGTRTPDDDDIEMASGYFSVSPLMVRTTLVNKGVLSRSELGQARGAYAAV